MSGLLIGRKQFADIASSILSSASLGMSLLRSPFASLLLAKSFHQPARTNVVRAPAEPPQG
jgi:hypothetical protein